MSRFTTRNSTALTERQQAVLDYVRQFYAENGICPSSRQIARQFNLASQTSAMMHVKALVRKGNLRKCPESGRLILPDKMIPWEDVKPIFERACQGKYIDPEGAILTTFFTKHPHLKP